MPKLFKSPLIQCLAIGGIIVAFQFSNRPLPVVEISQQEIAAFRDQMLLSYGNQQVVDEEKIIEKITEDKIIYREAKALGFDKTDSVKVRLANVASFLQIIPASSSIDERYQAALKMKLDETDIVVRRQMISLYKTSLKHSAFVEPPTEKELKVFYLANSEQFQQLPRYAFSHVYVQQANKNGFNEAKGLRELLNAKLEAIENYQQNDIHQAIELGDVFYGGHHFNLQSQRQIAKHFGQNFSEKMSDVILHQWSDPIQSAFGWHLIWLEQNTEQKLKPLAEVREKIIRKLTQQKKEKIFRQQLLEIREKYQLVVEESNLANGNPSDLTSAPGGV